MKKMTIYMTLVMLLLFGTLTFVGLRFSKHLEEYQKLEDNLKEAAEIYLNVNNIKLMEDEELKIESKTLIEHNYIDNTIVNNDACDAYVLVSYVTIKPYINCNKYTTEGYSE